MANLKEIRESEHSVDYWKQKSLYWWRRYLRNVKLIADLRRQNRKIRLLLSDYVNAETQEFEDGDFS